MYVSKFCVSSGLCTASHYVVITRFLSNLETSLHCPAHSSTNMFVAVDTYFWYDTNISRHELKIPVTSHYLFICVQALGKIKVSVEELDVDYLTIVGHKFYGPRIGALFVKGLEDKSTPIYPMLYGGGQERGLRSG